MSTNKRLITTLILLSSPLAVFAADPKITTYNGTSITGFLDMIQRWLLGFAGAIAILFIVIGGVKYMTAGGNEKQVASAKTTLTYAIIGLVLVLMSSVILWLIAGNLVGSIFGNSTSPFN